jgi:hypothetical protein
MTEETTITDAVVPAAPGYVLVGVRPSDDLFEDSTDAEIARLVYTYPIIAWHVETHRRSDDEASYDVRPITPNGLEAPEETAVEYPDGSVVGRFGEHEDRVAFAREVLRRRAEAQEPRKTARPTR